MDLNNDPRGQVLLKIQDMTTSITDSFAMTDPKYIPMFEGYTAYASGEDATMVYLVLTKGTRLLLYGVRVPTIPKSLMFSRSEADLLSGNKSVFVCIRKEMDHPDDVSYILAQEDDYEIQQLDKCSPEKGQSGEDFILGNALWLCNPPIN
tara:strand:- start:2413 stop:2862 length:450 start_codon:yes stop_codon:yes gene_type:complete